MILCAIAGRCHISLVVVEGDGTVQVVELHSIDAFVPTHKFVVPAEHVVPPVDGVGNSIWTAIGSGYPFLLHMVDIAVALHLNYRVGRKILCNVAPVFVGVGGLVEISVHRSIFNVYLQVGKIGEHLATVVGIDLVAYEEAREVVAYGNDIEAHLQCVENTAGVCAQNLFEAQESTVFNLALDEDVEKFVSVSVDTRGVVQSRVGVGLQNFFPFTGVGICLILSDAELFLALAPRVVLYLQCHIANYFG